MTSRVVIAVMGGKKCENGPSLEPIKLKRLIVTVDYVLNSAKS